MAKNALRGRVATGIERATTQYESISDGEQRVGVGSPQTEFCRFLPLWGAVKNFLWGAKTPDPNFFPSAPEIFPTVPSASRYDDE